jgi:hypothetical protein
MQMWGDAVHGRSEWSTLYRARMQAEPDPLEAAGAGAGQEDAGKGDGRPSPREASAACAAGAETLPAEAIAASPMTVSPEERAVGRQRRIEAQVAGRVLARVLPVDVSNHAIGLVWAAIHRDDDWGPFDAMMSALRAHEDACQCQAWAGSTA